MPNLHRRVAAEYSIRFHANVGANIFPVQETLVRQIGLQKMMRAFFLVLLISTGFGAVKPIPALAQPVSQYPFCIQSGDYPGWTGCSFPTLQACQATASGLAAECLANPWYKPGPDAAPAPQQAPIGINGPLPVGPPPN